jgi:hypothetical protein
MYNYIGYAVDCSPIVTTSISSLHQTALPTRPSLLPRVYNMHLSPSLHYCQRYESNTIIIVVVILIHSLCILFLGDCLPGWIRMLSSGHVTASCSIPFTNTVAIIPGMSNTPSGPTLHVPPSKRKLPPPLSHPPSPPPMPPPPSLLL